ncbi:hypothetical protein D9758_006502 [Tetrapyrgos nigripes]|uniref:Uncharacterized protein n=1 Tax=Tetrapyrgos nigripes TaxID=182062 RepID=A0A8H5GKU2_9AGAR|nr:hypothetical protein D9758_006502 [Tetrapyrgos nigripes]
MPALEPLTQWFAVLLILSLGLCDGLIIFHSYSSRIPVSTAFAVVLAVYHLAIVIAGITSPLLGETFKSLRTRRAHSVPVVLISSALTLLFAGLALWATVDPINARFLLSFATFQVVATGLPIIIQLVAIAHIAWGCSEVAIREGAIQLREDEPIPDTDADAQPQNSSPPSDTIALDPKRPVSMRFLITSLLITLMSANIVMVMPDLYNYPLTLYTSVIIILHHLILIFSSVDRVHFDSISANPGAIPGANGTNEDTMIIATRTTFFLTESISSRLRSTLARRILVGLMPIFALLSAWCAFFLFYWAYEEFLVILQVMEAVGLMVFAVRSWYKMRRDNAGYGPVLADEEERLEAEGDAGRATEGPVP